MTLELAAAYWVLGLLKGELLPDIASEALDCGRESDSLLILAGEQTSSLREHGEMFLDCLRENQIPVPDREQAMDEIAKFHAGQILACAVTPVQGARAIIQEVVDESDKGSDFCNDFRAFESQYSDFTDKFRIDYYGDEYCQNVRKDMEDGIIEAAKALLASDA